MHMHVHVHIDIGAGETYHLGYEDDAGLEKCQRQAVMIPKTRERRPRPDRRSDRRSNREK